MEGWRAGGWLASLVATSSHSQHVQMTPVHLGNAKGLEPFGRRVLGVEGLKRGNETWRGGLVSLLQSASTGSGRARERTCQWHHHQQQQQH